MPNPATDTPELEFPLITGNVDTFRQVQTAFEEFEKERGL